MILEYTSAIYSATNFHSTKNNKDYHKVGLILDGTAGEFFVSDKVWSELVKSPMYNAITCSPIPQACVAVLELRFTDKGPRVDVAGIKPYEQSKGK